MLISGTRGFTAVSRQRTLVLALAAIYGMAPQMVRANPAGAVVVQGQATMQTQGNRLTVTNTPGAIIHWQQFSIGAGETTYFQQQNAASTVLNRVQAQNPALKSQIDGTLGSNGKVFLINPNGVMFGAGSVIDTQGFVASTLSLRDEDFKAGKFKFARDGVAGDIQVQGQISSGQGDVYLVAPHVGTDGTAVIRSEGGNIVLAAGEMVEITGRNLNDIRFEVQNRSNTVVNLGRLEGGAVGVFAGTLRHSGVLQAQTLAQEGGRLVLRAQGDVQLTAGSQVRADGQTVGGVITVASTTGNVTVDTGAQVSAQATSVSPAIQASTVGGSIAIHAMAGYVALEGGSQLSADAGQGGHILVAGAKLVQDGAVHADGSSGFGGTVRLQADSNLMQGASATVSATGVLRGGDIHVGAATAAGGIGHVYSSGSLDASASSGVGGSVTVSGRDLTLAATRVRADGDAGGGTIRVGGGRAGADTSMANAQNLTVSAATQLDASAQVDGDGGSILTWGDASNRFAGAMSARGGAGGGNGGFLEVSAGQNVQFGGSADAGAPRGQGGQFLLDPKFIVIKTPELIAGVSVELLDPNPGSGDLFGQSVQVLGNGNILVFNANDDFAGTNSGAVYLFDGLTGALLSNLRGSTANDRVGSGSIVRYLSGGNLLVSSPFWNGSAGALTTINPATGVSGAVSSANSLVGGVSGDQVGSSGTSLLVGGRMAIFSPNWSSGAGAITWADSGSGITGVVSSANSLVGAMANDRVGNSGISSSGSGKYYVATSAWNGNAGAMTWIDPAAPVVGTMGSGNSLVGAAPGDRIGSGGIYDIVSGKWTIFSPQWNGDRGAVTFMDQATGNVGIVGAGNSLVGSEPGDRVGSGYWDHVGSKIAILSPNWANGVNATDAGAITWFDAASIVTGAVSSANSLVGSHTNDRVSDASFEYLDGVHFLVVNRDWNTGTGAVTWVDSAAMPVGVVSSANSLVGSMAGDQIGSGSVENFGFGIVGVFSPQWNLAKGAVSWISTTSGTVGVVGAANSLIGTNDGDRVGSDPYRYLTGTQLAIVSSHWANTPSAPNAGAITWVDASTGLVGQVSAANSLVGGATNDRVGSNSVVSLDGSHFAVVSPQWNVLSGAVTWIDSAAPTLGLVSGSNSLVGSAAGDRVGSDGVVIGSAKTMVFSPNWSGDKGAVTWLDNVAGTFGAVDATNSLVGSTAGDRVGGSADYQTVGNYVAIFSPGWTNVLLTASAAGAISWADPLVGIVGPVSAGNSLVGGSTNDRVGMSRVDWDYGTLYKVRTTAWSGNAGAITWIDRAAPVVGVVSAANSLVGAAAGDQIANNVQDLYNGKSLVLSPNWGGNRGAVTWFDNVNGTLGVVGAGNSLVGTTGGSNATGDRVGASSYQQLGNQIALRTPNWNNGAATLAGAVTFADAFIGISGPVSAANSLVGTQANDRVGASFLSSLSNGNFYLATTTWNSNAGAVTFVNPGSAPLVGVVGAGNSLVGGTAGDLVGGSGVQNLFNGKAIVLSPAWNGAMGAVTWFDTVNGTNGTVSAANSLVGSTVGDAVGSAGRTAAGNFIGIRSPNWDNGSNSDAGAITWADAFAGITGAVSAANSLVGGGANDRVGSNAADTINSSVSAVRTPDWGNQAGAVTWIQNVAPTTGLVSAANSLVGGTAGDRVGSGGFSSRFGLNYTVLRSSAWSGNRGAVTWIDPSVRLTGVVSSANSLVGANPNDFVGSAGVSFLTNGDYYVRSTAFGGGAGAVSVGRAAGGIGGVVSASNSLVGQSPNDAYGGSVQEINGSRLLVRAFNADSGGLIDNGRLHIYAGGAGGGGGFGGPLAAMGFLDNSASLVTISPAQIAAILNTGTSVTLQASSDITLEGLSDIIVNNSSGIGGKLTLQAGRSVYLNSSVLTDDADLDVIANELTSRGVLTSQRDPGFAEIVMANGTRIDAGTGTVTLHLRDGAGRTGSQAAASAIQMRSINAGTLFSQSDTGSLIIGGQAATAPSEIVVLGNARLIAKTSVSLFGGVSGAQALLAAEGQITIASPNPQTDPAPVLILTNGGSLARIVNSRANFPLILSGSQCVGCIVVSDYEITGANFSLVENITGSLLSLHQRSYGDMRRPPSSEDDDDDIGIDAGETCQ